MESLSFERAVRDEKMFRVEAGVLDCASGGWLLCGGFARCPWRLRASRRDLERTCQYSKIPTFFSFVDATFGEINVYQVRSASLS